MLASNTFRVVRCSNRGVVPVGRKVAHVYYFCFFLIRVQCSPRLNLSPSQSASSDLMLGKHSVTPLSKLWLAAHMLTLKIFGYLLEKKYDIA